MEDKKENGLRVSEKSHELVMTIVQVLDLKEGLVNEFIAMELLNNAIRIPTLIEAARYESVFHKLGMYQEARSSGNKCNYLLLLSNRLEYIPPDIYTGLNEELELIMRMMMGLIKSVEKKIDAMSMEERVREFRMN